MVDDAYRPGPDTWYAVYVHTPDRSLDVGAVVRYQHYDAQILDDGTLRVELQDRGAVYLFATGQWARLEAKPAPEDVAQQMETYDESSDIDSERRRPRD
jgi:hypothetical protein